MDIGAVMDEIGDQLDTISGLRVYRWPADNVAVPAAVVTYPTVTYDETYVRGMDRYALSVVVMVGKVSERAARDRIAAYAAGAGPSSIKQAVEAHTYEACDTVRVEGTEEPDAVSMGGVEYLAYTFNLDITGPGGT